jgi:hypothetical protein
MGFMSSNSKGIVIDLFSIYDNGSLDVWATVSDICWPTDAKNLLKSFDLRVGLVIVELEMFNSEML